MLSIAPAAEWWTSEKHEEIIPISGRASIVIRFMGEETFYSSPREPEQGDAI